MSRPVQVIYVAGVARCGSTFFSDLLASKGFGVAAGEVMSFFHALRAGNRRCSCGVSMESCPFWGPVAARMAEVLNDREIAALEVGLTSRFDVKHGLAISVGLERPRAPEFERPIRALYRALQEASSGRPIIDSSKRPGFAAFLQSQTKIDFWLVHLVRDPRAVVYSKKRILPSLAVPGEMMPRRDALVTSLKWYTGNLAAGRLGRSGGRYLRVRYESLVSDTSRVVDELRAFLPASDSALVVCRESDHHHQIEGNPSRFQSRPQTLRVDAEWKTALSSRDWAIATLVTTPLRARYGYGMRRPKAEA